MTRALGLSLLTLLCAHAFPQTTTLLHVNSDGMPGNLPGGDPSASADGRHVAFASRANNLVPGDNNNASDVFVHDRVTGITVCASRTPAGIFGDGHSYQPVISATGRFVTYDTNATNLVPNKTDSDFDVLVYDRDPDGNGTFDEGNATLALVSVNRAGVTGA